MAVDPTFATNDMVCGGEYLAAPNAHTLTATAFLYFINSKTSTIPWQLELSHLISINAVTFSGKNVAAVGFTKASEMVLIYVYNAADQTQDTIENIGTFISD
jgi:hypothetical protein